MFADVTNDMTIAQEEIFGPVVSIITYEAGPIPVSAVPRVSPGRV